MNGAPALLGPTRKLAESPLNTIPVGAPSTLTLRFRLTPLARYSVEKSAPLSETHHGVAGPATRPQAFRSEEHTSELQSHSDLVCRLLLEKKKKSTNQTPSY